MNTRLTHRDLLATIEDMGHRLTGPRHDIVELLGEKQEGFTAEEIRNGLPGVGRATVYRTLKLLLKAGVVCKLVLPDGAPKYTLACFGHHHHTVCVSCGTISDFRDSTIERVLRSVASDGEVEMVGHRVELYVICRSCRTPTGK